MKKTQKQRQNLIVLVVAVPLGGRQCRDFKQFPNAAWNM
jgi:hypothetical protein